MFTTVKKIFRYGLVTGGSYLALLTGTFLAVEIGGVPPIPAYIAVLTGVYLGVYFASSRFVFNAHSHRAQWPRYVIAVIIFWMLNAVLYAILVEQLQLQYLIAALTNILIFGPLRYFTYSRWVFPTHRNTDTPAE